MGDLVSVIIPTYKRPDSLKNAIKSVVNQTYKNIEIIVVDDNSKFPDYRKKTKEIVKEYPQIILIENKKNLGGALSRNEGIYIAKGKFIAFLDDDDTYREDKIEKQYDLYQKNKDKKIGLVFCNDKDINENENIIYQQMMGCIAPTSFWFLPKKVLEEVNYFEDSPCKQDSILFLKILLAGYHTIKVPERLVQFNVHSSETGISGTKLSNIEGILNYRKLCRENYDRLDSSNQVDNVECNFSKQLITLYLINHLDKEAKEELKNIKKRKPFSKMAILGMCKIKFKRIYLKWLG